MNTNNREPGMRKPKAALTLAAAFGLAALLGNAYQGWRPASATRLPALSAVPAPSAPVSSDEERSNEEQNDAGVRFLADRVKRDPENFVALNMLAGYHLQRLRETGSLDYLDRAQRAARASLAALPAERNTGGLAALTQTEYASHEFGRARDHALRLTQIDPGKSGPYGMLGEALVELGDYDKARSAFQKMTSLSSGAGTETRLARLALLDGEPALAKRHYFNAISYALALPDPPRETLAWCRWQMGETAFSVGDYPAAEEDYRAALTTFPGYFRALASLGRVQAARGDLPGAIGNYEHAVNVIPDPAFVAALGDLYQIAGRKQDAAAQYALVEAIGHLSKLNGTLYNRQLALFYADHNRKPNQAYASAVREYAVRRDIYGADALAWTALKAGKLAVAQKAIQEALRLGTRDAKMDYHAGMIARAAGDMASARAYLQSALALNPQFDPLQAPIARRTLASLSATAGKKETS